MKIADVRTTTVAVAAGTAAPCSGRFCPHHRGSRNRRMVRLDWAKWEAAERVTWSGPHASHVNSHQLTCAPEPLESQYEWSITKRNRMINLAVHARVVLPRCFSELAVFDVRLYIRVRRIPANARLRQPR